jgi:hypothetical protein
MPPHPHFARLGRPRGLVGREPTIAMHAAGKNLMETLSSLGPAVDLGGLLGHSMVLGNGSRASAYVALKHTGVQ